MQVNLRLFGVEVLHFEIAEIESEPEVERDNGYLGSTPVGFVARMEVPDLADLPDRE